jgi:hypothetical protein
MQYVSEYIEYREQPIMGGPKTLDLSIEVTTVHSIAILLYYVLREASKFGRLHITLAGNQFHIYISNRSPLL